MPKRDIAADKAQELYDAYAKSYLTRLRASQPEVIRRIDSV